MTRYGIVGDIHGNDAALIAALAALDQRGFDQLLCLGDIVGFNPGSNLCVDLLAERKTISIGGNHDCIALGDLGFERCADKVTHALRKTRKDLGAESRRFLADLPPFRMREERLMLMHGAIGDVQRYLRTTSDIQSCWAQLVTSFPRVEICFFGHTHQKKVYAISHDGRVTDLPGDEHVLHPGNFHFVNPGCVDASRQRDCSVAECAVFDSADNRLTLIDAPYDQPKVEAEAVRRGYRQGPAARLLSAGRRWFT